MTTYQHTEALPVTYDVDVLVVGGGPAGVAAAIAAAREGAKVLIVEQFNCLGGIATAGGHGHISTFYTWIHDVKSRIVGGIPYEICQRLINEGYGAFDGNNIDFELEGLKFVLDTMVKECGIQVLYYTFFCESIVEDGAITGIIVQNKSGRQLIRARRVIDCTGDGDVAMSAGAPHEIGRPSDSKCQPVTLMFTVGGVDWERVKAWRTSYHMVEVWQEAQRNGDMEPFQTTLHGFWWTPTRPDQVGVNFTHITDISAASAEALTHATIEGRRQAYLSIDVFRKYVPGMEQCYMVSTPNTIGVRESRRILADVVLTEQDMYAYRQWDDSIGYGSFLIDIHAIDGPGLDKTSVENCGPGFRYQIPYRILVPRDVDNLLTAGRCVSVTHLALGSIRVMAQCMVTGQAAGVAAARSLREGTTPRQVNVAELQAALHRDNCILTEDDIIREETAIV